MWNVVAPMVAGFLIDKIQGGSGIKGAAGGAFGSMFSPYMSGSGAAGGKGMAGNTAANSLNAGNLLGQGGFQNLNALGMNSAVNAGLGGLTTSIPETAGGYSNLYGGDSMLQNYDIGMNGVQSNLNAFTPTETALNIAEYGPLTGLTEAERNINTFGPLTGPQSNGYIPAQMDAETAANIKQYGGLETPVPETSGMFSGGLLDYLGEFVPEKKDLGGLALSMGLNALTPEQQERIRHQQAMVSRGQTGSLLGQGGYQGIGGQYISRAQ
jgi:hypothetical protein